MTRAGSCSSCGGALAHAHGTRVCPRCALGLALESESNAVEASVERRMGSFRLTRVLGEGGMGVVWEAEQEEPVRRRVALKWIRPGMDTEQVLARFEAERQALALMSSPHIAQVFDAGRSEDGRPWVAMEYVEGPWITSYCDTERLPIAARLALFVEVCHGVQHAHQKGVIHRDIKPSNVLVEAREGRPVPKIIDFGLAKAIGAQLLDHSLVTHFGQRVGTPGYMSPEQSGPAGFDVDTRTDVYALGVLLYELLTGRLPIESETNDIDDLRRRIRDEDPPPPSARIAALEAEVARETARLRRSEPASLVSTLSGDLDWIAAHALAKDRALRYGTPDELAADVTRHLAHEPVLAGPPSLSYRARKFVRRHTAGVAVGGTILLLLTATAIGTSFQAGRIARERDRANREARTARSALGFLTETFHLSDPEQARGATITAREILDRATAKLEPELGDSPEVLAEMTLTMAHTYNNLGLYEQAEPLARRAVELRSAIFGRSHRETHAAMLELVDVLERRTSLDEAEALIGEVRAGDPTLAARARFLSGRILGDRGKLEQAVPELEGAVEELGRTLGPEAKDTLHATLELGNAQSRHGRYAEAAELFPRLLEAQRRTLGPDHPDAASTLNSMAINARRAGRYAEAEPAYREALGLLLRVQGPQHPDVLATRTNLGQLLVEMERFDEAEPQLREALDGRRAIFGATSPMTLMSLSEWAQLAFRRKDYDAAEHRFGEALAGFRQAYGDDHPETIRVLNNLGQVLRSTGRLADAEATFRTSVARARAVFGEGHPNTLVTQSNLAETIDQRGRHEEALVLLVQSLDGLRRAFPDGHALIGLTERKRGACLRRLGRDAEAERALLDAHAMLTAKVGPEHSNTRAAAGDLVALYEAWGKPELAAKWRR